MSQGGMRFDSGKLNIGLIPVPALLELALVFTKGAIKYAAENWRLGIRWSRVYTPMERHLAKWKLGQQRDPENGCHHLLQVAWGCVVLYMYERWANDANHPEQDTHFKNDDRPDKLTNEKIDTLFAVKITPTEQDFLERKVVALKPDGEKKDDHFLTLFP